MLFCYGTRPEFIKIKPIISKLDKSEYKILYINQHKDIVDKNYDFFLKIEDTDNRLDSIFISVMKNLDSVVPLDLFTHIIVQGDTATACAISLAAFHRKKNIIHLEAGLRTFDLENPYPEEFYRQVISKVSYINLCPTEQNAKNLRKEKCNKKSIFVVGNTVLDNIKHIKPTYENKILVTLHRRENHKKIKKWFEQIDKLAKLNPELEFLLPIHPNPNVVKHKNILKNVKVIDPIPHEELINYMSKCKLIISDSGGIQEEGSFLNKKIIVCRKKTERNESINIHSFICKDPKYLEDIFNNLIMNYKVDSECPYGDGNSSDKIIDIFKKNIKII